MSSASDSVLAVTSAVPFLVPFSSSELARLFLDSKKTTFAAKMSEVLRPAEPGTPPGPIGGGLMPDAIKKVRSVNVIGWSTSDQLCPNLPS